MPSFSFEINYNYAGEFLFLMTYNLMDVSPEAN